MVLAYLDWRTQESTWFTGKLPKEWFRLASPVGVRKTPVEFRNEITQIGDQTPGL